MMCGAVITTSTVSDKAGADLTSMMLDSQITDTQRSMESSKPISLCSSSDSLPTMDWVFSLKSRALTSHLASKNTIKLCPCQNEKDIEWH